MSTPVKFGCAALGAAIALAATAPAVAQEALTPLRTEAPAAPAAVTSYRHELGVVLRLLGRVEEALPHARDAHAERSARLGAEHRDTRASRLLLARVEGDAALEAELVAAGAAE